ncbi:MAG TPA: hypothetical protein VE988_24160 [Gemmataceae bacterium]|nr:hypothetical protein [Gemmataceae bacterium]
MPNTPDPHRKQFWRYVLAGWKKSGRVTVVWAISGALNVNHEKVKPDSKIYADLGMAAYIA